MYGEERKTQIVELIEKNNRVNVAELCIRFQVSESTIRRDLKELEEAGHIKRTHGGALPIQNVTFEPTFSEKEIEYLEEKKAIAKKAVEFIENGDTILIDSGTTTFYLFKQLKKFQKLTVITNSFIFPKDLELHSGIEFMMLGGLFRQDIFSFVGPFADYCLDMIKVDKAFMATNALDLKEGLSTPNLMEATTKKKMIERSDQVILLTDSSKAGKINFSKFAKIEDIDVCITDSGISSDYQNVLQQSGIDVHIVDPIKE